MTWQEAAQLQQSIKKVGHLEELREGAKGEGNGEERAGEDTKASRIYFQVFREQQDTHQVGSITSLHHLRRRSRS